MLLDYNLLDTISEGARLSERLRMNHNLHHSLDAKAQRLFNALEPGTELPIHRHRHTDETYIVVRGHIHVLFYDERREIVEQFDLNPSKGHFGVHIPQGQWHTLEVVESGTVIFEVKDGPYAPLTEEDIMR